MKTFEELGVPARICQALAELGYDAPMPVQEEVIPHLLAGNIDMVALAQTGTGKTAAFGLPLLSGLEHTSPTGRARALVLCPTRELCLQISDDLKDYSKYMPEVTILPVYGGSSIETQIRMLKKGVDVIVATPGRLIDLMERGVASLEEVEMVVLDEADEMLNMGFTESIETILSQVPKERRLLLFSATMPKSISTIAKKYLNNPKEVVIGSKNSGNANIQHVYYMVSSKHKYLALKRIVDYYPNIYGIVFCRTRKETQEIADLLIKDGYNADALHGELSQAQRDYVMQKFRVRNLQLLIATDVAARGLDVNDLTHVIHYGLPDDVESYTHRSGRTARAGKKGLSIAICHAREGKRLREIEKIISSKIERKMLPKGSDICQKQVMNLADRLERVVVEEDSSLDGFMPEILRKLNWLEKDDLIRRLVYMEFRRLLEYYEEAGEIEEADSKGRLSGSSDREGKKRAKGQAEPGMTRLFINFGKMDKMYPNKLIELINKCVPGKVKIGKIDLMPRFSFFEVDEHDAEDVVSSMNMYEVDGRPISVEYAEQAGEGKPRRERRERKGNGTTPKKKSRAVGDTSSKKKSKSREAEPFYERFTRKRK